MYYKFDLMKQLSFKKPRLLVESIKISVYFNEILVK